MKTWPIPGGFNTLRLHDHRAVEPGLLEEEAQEKLPAGCKMIDHNPTRIAPDIPILMPRAGKAELTRRVRMQTLPGGM
jgi:hypothetical protein